MKFSNSLSEALANAKYGALKPAMKGWSYKSAYEPKPPKEAK